MTRATSRSAAVLTTSLEEQKRLGQFFTGEPLARLLASLADAATAARIIDPMAGSGDMLAAAYEAGASKVLAGVEIDPEPARECITRLSASQAEVRIAVGDAFAPATWGRMPSGAWDLVITNPPYVRYQRGARGGGGRVKAPSAEQVRGGLVEILGRRVDLPPADRIVFEHLARSYSGLADLAVPAWILCASLVGLGGRLAMVVPDTWLTRDYALPVLYLLTRYFDIETVVEDGEAAWFEEALVRTTLVVARRIADRNETGATAPDHAHVRLWPAAADEDSLVGAALPHSPHPEHAFASLVRGRREAARAPSLSGVDVESVDGTYYQTVVARQGSGSRWWGALESGAKGATRPHVPRQTLRLIDGTRAEFRTLESYGWRVGQGLRTGANRFFYGSCVEERPDESLIAVDPAFRSDAIVVPRDAVRPVIRRQQEALAGATTKGRVLYLLDHALPEDVEATRRAIGFCPYAELPEPLAEHVRVAGRVNVGTHETPRFVPQLSAVATNARPLDRASPEKPPRFWYQLPPLADRHVPDLFLPRINYERPRPVVNHAGLVIDANFSTFWRAGREALAVPAVAALLRSTWVWLALESSGTVLGGGALKIEATHLRRLPLPELDDEASAALAELGEASMDGELLPEIDRIVWDAIGVSRAVDPREILVPLVERRSRPGGRTGRLEEPAETVGARP